MVEGEASGPRQIAATVAALAVSYALRSRGQTAVMQLAARVGAERMATLVGQPDLWIDYDEAMAVVTATAEICDEDDIGYRIGEEAARFMYDQGRLQGFRGRSFLDTIGSFVELLNDGNRIRSLAIDSANETGYARIVAHSDSEHRDRFLCRFGTGLLTSIPAYIGRAGVATEVECISRGATACVFEVRWSPATADRVGPSEPTAMWTSSSSQDARSEILRQVIEGLALPQHVLAVGATLTSDDGTEEISYRRGSLTDGSGASYTADITGVPGFAGTTTIVFAGQGLPAVDRALARSCAEQISTILTTASTLSELHERARRDPLTGLANRAQLEERAAGEAASDGTAVVFLDLDGFKAVNDDLGHRAGDLLLAELGRRLRDAVRASDLVVRYGGDEFVAVIHGTQSLEDAELVAAKLKAAIAEPVTLDGRTVVVGASLGIARAPDDGDSLTHLVATADQRMYQDKRARR